MMEHSRKYKIMKKSLIVGLFLASLFLILLYVTATTTINECQDLTTAGETYLLGNGNESAAICFTISADYITLDCQNNQINHSLDSSGSGIKINGVNHSRIFNCIINSDDGDGILINDAINITLENITIDNIGTNDRGISISKTRRLVMKNIKINTTGQDTRAISIDLTNNHDFFFDNIRLFSEGTSTGCSASNIKFGTTASSWLANVTIQNLWSYCLNDYNLCFPNNALTATQNISLINITYADANENNESIGTGTYTIYKKWWLDVDANIPTIDVNVTLQNNNQQEVYTTSDTNGDARIALTDYYYEDSATKKQKYNYTITLIKTGYTSQVFQRNMTQNRIITANFNNAPYIITNLTVPGTPALNNSNVYINVSANDTDLDDILWINFTIKRPDGNLAVNNKQGTVLTGNADLGIIENWISNYFNITWEDGSLGLWTWNFTASDNDSNPVLSYGKGQFYIIDNVLPSINITFPRNNTVFYQNLSINVTFQAGDDLNISSIFYSINEGVNNFTIANPQTNRSFAFGYANNSMYNITMWINDTQGNFSSYKVYGINITYDVTAPTASIISPNTTYCSRLTIPINITFIELGGISSCTYNVTYRDTGLSAVSNTLIPYCNYTTFNAPAESDYNFYLLINDTTGNKNIYISNFSADSSASGCTTTAAPSSGGGGGSILQKIIEEVKEKVCIQKYPAFKVAFDNFIKEKTWQNFKIMWFALWDYNLCEASAEIIPLLFSPLFPTG